MAGKLENLQICGIKQHTLKQPIAQKNNNKTTNRSKKKSQGKLENT